jgi:hypothetical protein
MVCGGLATPGICAAGTCHVGKDCLIAGVPYTAGDPHPQFACLACQCRVVAKNPPATGGGSCAAPDYNTIQAAVDAASAGDTIIICPGTYNLTATVTVPVDLSFVGSGQANTIIDGANGGSGVQLFNGDGIGLSGGRHVTFRGLTFRNGRATGALLANGDPYAVYGGAIAATTVEVSDSTFTGNTARSPAEVHAMKPLVGGGAIAATDTVVRGCIFDGNVVQTEHDTALLIGGGAIFAQTIDVADTTFTKNRVVENNTDTLGVGGGGGAIYGRRVDVQDSTFSNNAAISNNVPVGAAIATGWWAKGGAIYVKDDSTPGAMPSYLNVVRSTFADNAAADRGGPIVAYADVVLVESALLRNTAYTGGAIAQIVDGPAVVVADKSTFDGNVSYGGGAIAGHGVVLANSTFTNNAASGAPRLSPSDPGYDPLCHDCDPCRGVLCGSFDHPLRCCEFGNGAGGAIAAKVSVSATNCIFAGNVGVSGTIHSGPSNYASAAAAAILTNTILASPPGVSMCAAFPGTSTNRIDGGGNFSVDASCAFTQPTSHANVSAAALALQSLADNGGRTPTVALSPGSIANGAGTCALDTDQRGRPRPGPGNPACESGAYELQAGAGTSCLVDENCDSNVCDGVCKCPRSQLYTFGAAEQPGSVWPGGTSTQSASPGCSVTVQNPNADVSLNCGLGAPFSVLGFAGYSSCSGSGGEDGDGWQVTSCPPPGQGSCCNGRPACSGNPPGTAAATFSVQCLP